MLDEIRIKLKELRQKRSQLEEEVLRLEGAIAPWRKWNSWP